MATIVGADRDVVTIYPHVVAQIHAFTLRPSDAAPGLEVIEESKPFVDVVVAALGLDKLRVVETGGTAYESERQQWDSGNLVAITIVGAELGRGSGGGHCMTCPIIRDPVD